MWFSKFIVPSHLPQVKNKKGSASPCRSCDARMCFGPTRDIVCISGKISNSFSSVMESPKSRSIKIKRFLSTLILFLIVMMPIIANAGWSNADTVREVIWQGLHVVDWGQTLEIARDPGRYYEMNPALGSHPSVGKVNIYMASSAVLHAGVSYVLPGKWRSYWQYVSIVTSGACVANNFNIGLGVRF